MLIRFFDCTGIEKHFIKFKGNLMIDLKKQVFHGQLLILGKQHLPVSLKNLQILSYPVKIAHPAVRGEVVFSASNIIT
jgi:hypothetical protein